MFSCVWRCYKIIKCMNSAEDKSSSKMLQKVSLVRGQVPSLPFTVTLGARPSPSLGLSCSTCKMKARPEEM